MNKRKLTPPTCWAGLINLEFNGEVQITDPKSSGTAWTMLPTIVQPMGEDKGFEYQGTAQEHQRIHQGCVAPALAAGQGEALIGICSTWPNTTSRLPSCRPARAPATKSIFSAFIAGAKHIDEAKKFYDWALTSNTQKIAATAGSFQIPSNPDKPVPPIGDANIVLVVIEGHQGEHASVRLGPLLLTLQHHGAMDGSPELWVRPQGLLLAPAAGQPDAFIGTGVQGRVSWQSHGILGRVGCLSKELFVIAGYVEAPFVPRDELAITLARSGVALVPATLNGS